MWTCHFLDIIESIARVFLEKSLAIYNEAHKPDRYFSPQNTLYLYKITQGEILHKIFMPALSPFFAKKNEKQYKYLTIEKSYTIVC